MNQEYCISIEAEINSELITQISLKIFRLPSILGLKSSTKCLFIFIYDAELESRKRFGKTRL